MPRCLSGIAHFNGPPERRKTLEQRVLRIIAKTLATFAKQTPGEQSPGVLLTQNV